MLIGYVYNAKKSLNCAKHLLHLSVGLRIVGGDMSLEATSRIETILAALLKHQLSSSLSRVEEALGKWRAGSIGPLAAHTEVVKHVARAERVAGRIASKEPERIATLLRDALDADLIEHSEFLELVGREPMSVEPSPAIDDMGQPDKRAFVEELLEQGPILVHVNARAHGVSVPSAFAQETKLVLRFGYSLTPPILGFLVDEVGITGTLTFGGVPHRCVLPWQSMYAVVAEGAQQIMVWSEDVPLGTVEQLPAPDQLAKRRSGKQVPHLRLVE